MGLNLSISFLRISAVLMGAKKLTDGQGTGIWDERVAAFWQGCFQPCEPGPFFSLSYILYTCGSCIYSLMLYPFIARTTFISPQMASTKS